MTYFCLRAREKGYRVVINPHVRGTHKTSTSRKGQPANIDEHIFYLNRHCTFIDPEAPRLCFTGQGIPENRAMVAEKFLRSLFL